MMNRKLKTACMEDLQELYVGIMRVRTIMLMDKEPEEKFKKADKATNCIYELLTEYRKELTEK